MLHFVQHDKSGFGRYWLKRRKCRGPAWAGVLQACYLDLSTHFVYHIIR